MSGVYDDIIDLPHHVSRKHPQQPMDKRAAQFSPFAALTGYDDAVEETARFTDRKLEIEDGDKAKINAALVALMERVKAQPVVSIRYFVPDPFKTGGKYVTTAAAVKKIDYYLQELTCSDGRIIPFDDIVSIAEIAEDGIAADFWEETERRRER